MTAPAGAPVKAALRRAVQYRLERGEIEVLALMTGITQSTLEQFARTGQINENALFILRAAAQGSEL